MSHIYVIVFRQNKGVIQSKSEFKYSLFASQESEPSIHRLLRWKVVSSHVTEAVEAFRVHHGR